MHGLTHVARGPLVGRAPEEALVGAAALIGVLLAVPGRAAPLAVIATAFVVLVLHHVPVRRALMWLAAPAGMLGVGLLPGLVHCTTPPWHCAVDMAVTESLVPVLARGVAIASVTAALAVSTGVGALLTGLRRLRVPASIVDLLGTTWSLAIVGRREALAMRTAARLRQGHDSTLAEWRTIVLLLPTLTARLLSRAARRADFAVLRGGRDFEAPRLVASPTAVGLALAGLPALLVWWIGR